MVDNSYIADDCAFEEQRISTLVVIESDDKIVDTGLLDASGNKLWRCKTPVGFIRFS